MFWTLLIVSIFLLQRYFNLMNRTNRHKIIHLDDFFMFLVCVCVDVYCFYTESNQNFFTLKITHSGKFTSPPGRVYVDLVIESYDCVLFTFYAFESLLDDIGVNNGRFSSHYRIPGETLDVRLLPFKNDDDLVHMLYLVPTHREIEIYVEAKPKRAKRAN